jgi:hypothetical protein
MTKLTDREKELVNQANAKPMAKPVRRTELRIESVAFKREQSSRWEAGVIVNEGEGPIIDLKGKVVPPPVWDYHTVSRHVLTIVEDVD